MQVRAENGYKIHDNDIKINDEDSIYILSYEFWTGFVSRYGCDVIIQLKKYDSVSQMLPRDQRRGK